jgi:hypothetical protein
MFGEPQLPLRPETIQELRKQMEEQNVDFVKIEFPKDGFYESIADLGPSATSITLRNTEW